MAVDFSSLVLGPCIGTFGIPITLTPVRSNPGAAAYGGVSGVWDEAPVIIETAAGYHSTNEPKLGIRLADWDALGQPRPKQGDMIDTGDPRYGAWEIIDPIPDGQGGATLKLRGVQPTGN
jgi:hypothetical protein